MVLNNLHNYTQIDWQPITFETQKSKFIAICPVCYKPLNEKRIKWNFEPFCNKHGEIEESMMLLLKK